MKLKGKKPRIVHRDPAGLVPYADNPMDHTDKEVVDTLASIREFGFTNPILIGEDDGIIAGHKRQRAAVLGELSEVPCIVLGHLTADQRRAYVIADNKLARDASWNDEKLYAELKALEAVGFDTGLTGFSETEFAQLQNLDKQEGEDDVPAISVNPVSALGDVWLLGDHRLVCGDSCDPFYVDLALDGYTPNLMVTDPPYGVEYDASWRGTTGALGKVLNDDRGDWREAWALFPGGAAYVWHAGTHSREVQESLESCKFEVRCQIIWAKPQHTFGRGHYHQQHEPCFYVVRKGGKSGWIGDRKNATVWPMDFSRVHVGDTQDEVLGLGPVFGPFHTTLWDMTHRKSETGHSTQKPVEAMRRPILTNSLPGDAIYDPFLGSGTTLIAAESTGRRCCGVELSPEYVDVIVKRWENFTGKKAKHKKQAQRKSA